MNRIGYVPLVGTTGTAELVPYPFVKSQITFEKRVNVDEIYRYPIFNSLRAIQNGRHFPDDMFKCIFLNENIWISLKTSLKFVPEVRINNIPSLVQIMAWRRPGDKPLSEPMMVSLLTQICLTRPQWVKWFAVTSLWWEGTRTVVITIATRLFGLCMNWCWGKLLLSI